MVSPLSIHIIFYVGFSSGFQTPFINYYIGKKSMVSCVKLIGISCRRAVLIIISDISAFSLHFHEGFLYENMRPVI